MPNLTLKQYMEGQPLKEAETMSPEPAPSELDGLFQELLTDIDQQLDDLLVRLNLHFHASVQKTAQLATNDPANKQQPVAPNGKLPWFKNGIKGFVNKLWHGDHASNPSWKVENFIALEKLIDEEVSWLSSHYITESSDDMANLAPVINDFKARLAKTIQRYMLKARSVAPVISHEPSVNEPSISNDGSVDPTIQAASDKWYASKNISPKQKSAVGSMLGKSFQIKPNRRQEAINFMKENGLDPNEPDQVRLVWPRHRHEAIPPVVAATAAAARHEPLAPPTPIGSANVFDHLDRKAASRLLEGTDITTKKLYYKSLLAAGL